MTAVAAAADERRKRGRPKKKRKDRVDPSLCRRQPRTSFASRRSSTHRPRSLLRDDYYDDDIVVEDEEEEEEEEGKEEERAKKRKKLKLLLKLHQESPITPPPAAPAAQSDSDASPLPSSSFHGDDEDEGYMEDPKPLRRKGRAGGSGGAGDDDRRDGKDGRRQPNPNCKDPASESQTLLPDRKTLELILDKIQKKDKYGVFAEPVDPEELPDYHEVIEHPMDFSTLRKKLGRNDYASLEEFEIDVFLICSNAMQYNAPETIYFKQARSMLELARKKFHTLRAESKCSEIRAEGKCSEIRVESKCPENILMSESNVQPNSVEKMPSTNLCKTPQERTENDTSLIVTFASTRNSGNEVKTTEAVCSEKSVKDSVCVETSSFVCESMSEKAEELSEKSFPSKIRQKKFWVDENRRTTYNMSNQHPVSKSDSVFTVSDTETKQLVDVGLDTEYPYARSLARFAAMIGPSAWRIASEKIKKVLPPGVKFGPGWVGEYEPLPIPLLSSESCQLVPYHNGSNKCSTKLKVDWETNEGLKNKENCITSMQASTILPSSADSTGICSSTSDPFGKESFSKGIVERNQAFFQLISGHQQQNRTNVFQKQKDKLSVNQMKVSTFPNASTHASVQALNYSSSVIECPVDINLRHPKSISEVSSSKSPSIGGDRTAAKSDTYKESRTSGIITSGLVEGGLPQRKNVANSCSHEIHTSLDPISIQTAVGTNSSAQGNVNQAINDPSKLMRMMSGMVPNHHNSPNFSLVNGAKQLIPVSPRKLYSGIPDASTGTDGNNGSECAASAAVNAWMSIRNSSEHKPAEVSAHSRMQNEVSMLCNPPWMFYPSVAGVQEVNMTRPIPQVPNHHYHQFNKSIIEKHGIQNKEQTSFPVMFATDMSRFRGTSPWQGLVPHAQPKHGSNMLPPDLNISFRPGSPVQQPSKILVDPQPDLALQL